jgi:hypothetical protein
MVLDPALIAFAHAHGRHQAAWRYTSTDLRRAASLGVISKAWTAIRRDAGAGEVGRDHRGFGDNGLMVTDDHRRDGMLLWLADHGTPALAEAAALVARGVGATRRFRNDELDLLDAARDALSGGGHGPISRALNDRGSGTMPALEALDVIARAVDTLRGDAAFQETTGREIHHTLPGGTFSHFVSADPGATWALNLAMLARNSALARTSVAPGMAGRILFRADLEPAELASELASRAARALEEGGDAFDQISLEWERGRDALSGLSRNSRAREAWMLVATLGHLNRAHLRRALGLSRAGADIQAHALADAKLVLLEPGGWLRIRQRREPEAEPAMSARDSLRETLVEFDSAMGEVDRLLAKPSFGRDR